MSKIQPPDSHHLSAAEGWLELGNHREAQTELDRISAVEQERIEVLALRWKTASPHREFILIFLRDQTFIAWLAFSETFAIRCWICAQRTIAVWAFSHPGR